MFYHRWVPFGLTFTGRQKAMDKQRLNFFLTCPSCKRKFGVTPETVFKYLDRLFKELEENLRKKAEEKVRKEES